MFNKAQEFCRKAQPKIIYPICQQQLVPLSNNILIPIPSPPTPDVFTYLKSLAESDTSSEAASNKFGMGAENYSYCIATCVE